MELLLKELNELWTTKWPIMTAKQRRSTTSILAAEGSTP
jgi:hypothetical protein